MFKPYQYFKDKYGNRAGNWQVCIYGQIMILPLAIEMYVIQKHWHKRDKGIKKIYRKELIKFLKQAGLLNELQGLPENRENGN